jgi:hypothetical protein
LGNGDSEKGNIFGHRYWQQGKFFILTFSQELKKNKSKGCAQEVKPSELMVLRESRKYIRSHV